jgi:hypothetical protein
VLSGAEQTLVSNGRTNYDLMLGSASGQIRLHCNVATGTPCFPGAVRAGEVVQLRFILGHMFRNGVALNVVPATICTVLPGIA